MKKSIFLLLILAAASALAPLTATAQMAPVTQGQIAGIGQTPIRWRMTPDQVKAAEPSMELFDAGRDGTTNYYQLDGLKTASLEGEVNWVGMLKFVGGALVGFDLRPVNETATPNIIGDAEAWSNFFALAMLRPKAFPEIAEPKLRAFREVQGANGSGADLGFQVQYRAWSARGAYYRESIWQGSYRNNVGVTRFQGRLSVPFGEPQLKDNGADRAGFVHRVSYDFGVPPSLERAMLADNTLFQSPKPKYQGNLIGIEMLRWNMNATDIANASLPTGTQLQKAGGNTFLVRNFKLRRDSSLPWLLELRLDKNGLSEFELRPENELKTEERIGLFNQTQTDDYQDALDEWIENTRRVEPDKWWVSSREVETRVKRTYRAQSGTGIGIGSTGFSYYAYTYPTYSNYKQFLSWPVSLPFTIRERAWSVSDNQFRQVQLLNAVSGPRVNVIRYQGRRDDKPFRGGTGETVKTKNPKIVLREVYQNYNVLPDVK